MIRWCMMHVVHLGLLFVCNGSAMILAFITQFFLLAAVPHLQSSPARVFFFGANGKMCALHIFPPRNLLLRFGWFGGDESTTGMKLARAYKRFKEWTAEHKIECSQPPFSEKMEAWTMVFGSCSANCFCIKSACFVLRRAIGR